MRVRVHVGMRGEVRWRVLDERGVPEIPRNPSGFAIAPIEGVRQSNLITDLGLDRVVGATFGVLGSAYRNYLHIGTSSAVPATTDTALGAEVQRGTTQGSTDSALSGDTGYDAINEKYIYGAQISKAITLAAPQNLTEFGFGDTNDTSVSIRELFRDETNTPITVSLLAGKIIDVQHTLRLEIAAPSAGTAGGFNLEQYDAANTLTSTTPYSYVAGPFVPSGASANVSAMLGAWNPASNSAFVQRVSAASAYGPLGNPTRDNAQSAAGVLASYTLGTYTRTRNVFMEVDDLNGTWYGIVLLGSSLTLGGYHVQFASPTTYVKPNSDTLSMSFVSTWGRS